MFLSHCGPHAASGEEILQAPQEYVDRFSNITHLGRRKYAGDRLVTEGLNRSQSRMRSCTVHLKEFTTRGSIVSFDRNGFGSG